MCNLMCKLLYFSNPFVVPAVFVFQTCMLCSPPMMLPNWCSVSAHQRMHKHRAPHVCPECGGTARQATFQTHLEESCLHFARRIGYRFLAFKFLSVYCVIAGSFLALQLCFKSKTLPSCTCSNLLPLYQVLQLSGCVRRFELHQVPHSNSSLWGVS